MNKEPAVILAAVTAFAVAILAALVAFGLDITDSQQSSILAVIAAVAPIVLGVVTRSKVFAPANVAAAVTAEGEVVSGPADTRIVDGTPVNITSDVEGFQPRSL